MSKKSKVTAQDLSEHFLDLQELLMANQLEFAADQLNLLRQKCYDILVRRTSHK